MRSPKKSRKTRRNGGYNPDGFHVIEQPEDKPLKLLKARNDTQREYIHSIYTNTLTFAIGPAGTGKTYVAAGVAADMLQAGEIDTIVITRPGVEAGEKFGFLPGELKDKYLPFIEPFLEVLRERIGKSYVEYLLKTGRIQASPLAFMRGSTFKRSLVIFDEAQNATPTQMKLFLTRIGEGSKVIVDGDVEQKDISGLSGLSDAIKRLKYVPSVGMVEFSIEECVRSGICRDILFAYR